ncbi:MAG: MOSC domain-containing protein [Candidatus Thiodiazotropha sp. (ex Semelilucina semeliformis)]|nr:MOSC domain-containing protein [Candidatus Thiodiazotropha sp. (ex Semelilucina semeliformis)]
MTEVRLSALHRYPVKSLAGQQLAHTRVDRFGLEDDRRWMVVDRDGSFLTQRELPEMTFVSTQVTGAGLTLEAPGMPSITLERPLRSIRQVSVNIWNDSCQAQLCEDKAHHWLSDFLGQDCQLVYMPDESIRQVDQRFAAAADRTAFADGFPLLLISQASLDDLNERLDQPMPMIRFRPNLVVAGCEPYEEDSWRLIRIGDLTFRVVKPCSRCKITTVDPRTGESGDEPLKTLAGYRRQGKQVFFGQNLLHDHTGELSVGMPLEVLQRYE